MLREAGAIVSIRGTWWDFALAEEDKALAEEIGVDFAPVADFRPGAFGRQYFRILQRLARESYRRIGWVNPWVFGPATKYLSEARAIKPDFTLVHCEAGLWVGEQLLLEGNSVGVDFEDWFSQDLLPEDRESRPVESLQRMERHLVRNAHCCLTTTGALAKALAQDAATSRIPDSIPNCFPDSDRKRAFQGPRDHPEDGSVSFHWFSQTIGKGRGLETLAKALPRLKGNWQVNLRGSLRGHQAWFDQCFPESLRPRVRVLDLVPNAELLGRIASHDVGLALEEPHCLSRDLTATNKIFEYLRGGLAVIATQTQGQQEVMASCSSAGVMIPPGDASALAAAMQLMIDDSEHLQSCRRHAFEAGGSTWAWECHAPRLLAAITAGLTGPKP